MNKPRARALPASQSIIKIFSPLVSFLIEATRAFTAVTAGSALAAIGGDRQPVLLPHMTGAVGLIHCFFTTRLASDPQRRLENSGAQGLDPLIFA
jgi:hypothetical protein